ncbi:FAD-binding oxidoreductase [Pseudomonas sp. FEN]|uniref:FAD-binding oxidoreductase n=1 Tax=Pseudomonas sp. FEN TaxID=2767468 RepID=UPI00174A3BA2|nr:FAD-binding oxidoreductase [Pseudomonas sp. FEN]
MSRLLLSWAGYPQTPQTAHPCRWRNDLDEQLRGLARQHGTTLPFGNGRSYGDSCLASSGQVLLMGPLNRFIEVDWENGEICAEAGVTLGEILELVIPRGWFLMVTPGTQFVTLGGAVANDVHGKNHHVRGTFGHSVQCFELHRSDCAPLRCSRQENPEWFTATIGGLGLTGVISWVCIRLQPIVASQIETTRVRFGHLNEFFHLATELDPLHEYSVAWIDCMAKGDQLGRGVFVVGDHARNGTLTVETPSRLSVPITPAVSLINRLSLKGFNRLYWHRQPTSRLREVSPYTHFFYPLDRISHWNRMYGRHGFQQFQCVLPSALAEAALAELLDAVAGSGTGSFLAVLKRCGDLPSPGLLSFPMPGTSLALDFPQSAKPEQTLFRRLDAIVREAGGRLYPAKDAHMSGNDFRQAYPAWVRLQALRDPALSSRFWERVTQ